MCGVGYLQQHKPVICFFQEKNQSKSITNCPPGISTKVEHCVTKGVYDETFGMGLLLLLFVRR